LNAAVHFFFLFFWPNFIYFNFSTPISILSGTHCIVARCIFVCENKYNNLYIYAVRYASYSDCIILLNSILLHNVLFCWNCCTSTTIQCKWCTMYIV
jgi:hypothetical protein